MFWLKSCSLMVKNSLLLNSLSQDCLHYGADFCLCLTPNLTPKSKPQTYTQSVNLNTKVWKVLKKVKKNWSHVMCNHYYQNKRHQGKSQTKNHLHSRRKRIHYTTKMVPLNQWFSTCGLSVTPVRVIFFFYRVTRVFNENIHNCFNIKSIFYISYINGNTFCRGQNDRIT